MKKCEFEKKSKPKANGNPLERIKSVDPTTFPPNYNAFYEQIKRALSIGSIYKTTTETYTSFENDPANSGYQLSKTVQVCKRNGFMVINFLKAWRR